MLPDGKRGDLGTITLKKGVTVTGRLRRPGQAAGGLLIEADRERGSGPEFEALDQMLVADAIRPDGGDRRRRAVHVRPPAARGLTGSCPPTSTAAATGRRAGPARVPGVFTPEKLTIKEGRPRSAGGPRLAPRGDRGPVARQQGAAQVGLGQQVFGRIDGDFWHARPAPTPRASSP